MDLGFIVEFLSSQTTYDYLSVIVGGITGALFACDRDLDIVGAITLGLMTGYGGGVVRDILLDGHGFVLAADAKAGTGLALGGLFTLVAKHGGLLVLRGMGVCPRH